MVNCWNFVKEKMDKLFLQLQTRVLKKFMESKYSLANNNAGMGVIEIVLIILILVGLAFTFKGKITQTFNTIFNSITSKVNSF